MTSPESTVHDGLETAVQYNLTLYEMLYSLHEICTITYNLTPYKNSFSPALARFSSPLELFPDRRAAIARMYVFMCEAKLLACLPCGCPIFCANLLPCLWIYHASNPYSQNDTRTLSRPISQHPSSNRHGGGCCEALG